MRRNRFALWLLTLVIAAATLTGCAEQPSLYDDPPVTTTEDYSLERVPLPDGRTVTCLWWNKGARSGSMSCDWEQAK